MKGTRTKHNAGVKACPGAGRGRRWRWRRSGVTGGWPSWRASSGSSEPDLQLEEAAARRAAGVFAGGGMAEGTASEAQVDLLYRQIGQLKVENDFLARNPRT